MKSKPVAAANSSLRSAHNSEQVASTDVWPTALGQRFFLFGNRVNQAPQQEEKRLPANDLVVQSMPVEVAKREILVERSPRVNLRLVLVAVALVLSAMLLG